LIHKPKKVAVFYGEASTTYSFPSGHPMSGLRGKSFWRLIKEKKLNLSKDIEIIKPVMATEEDIRLFHSQKYINFVKNLSKKGTGMLDQGDTPAFKGVFEASKYVVGSTLHGLNMVMSKKIDHAFNPIGGLHHARREAAAGFCVFNDPAIAIIEAKTRYDLKRILYIDIDAHHGDGVFYSFYDDPQVFIADIHEDGRFLYPGTGPAEEVGNGKAEGTKLSIPVPPKTNDYGFKKVFHKIEKFILKIEPQIIFFQCGGDGLKNDSISHLEYSPQAYRFAAEKLHQLAHKLCGGRIVTMGGGGYSPENTSKAWVNVVETFLFN
jgi:acetoin utilization protein AcuC|tara:strand:+ start:6744 stop:7706 length:963 start_codon:yes stop_codon:yes gene_type:complete